MGHLVNQHSYSVLPYLYLSGHSNTKERVYVCLTARPTKEQFCQWRLLVFRKMGEEQLKEMVCKVEDVDGGRRDYGTVARDLLEERRFNFKYPGGVCGKEGAKKGKDR